MNASALPPPLPPAPRSALVNVLAWFALVLCTLGLVLLAVEVLAYNAFSHTEAFATLRGQVMANPEAAALVATLSRWLPGMLVLSAVRSTLAVVGAIGLLKRREWARRLFVVLLAVAACWQGVSIATQWWLTSAVGRLVLALPRAATEEGARMQAQLATSLTSSHVSGAVFGLAFVGLYAWLAWQLCTPRIRAEFAAPRDAIPL